MKTFFKNKLVRVISFVLVLTSSFAFSVPLTFPGLVDWTMVARIREEGLHRSKVMEYESYIVDVLGARLTLSRDMQRAQVWALDEMKKMGLSQVNSEAYMDYGVTWDNEYVSAHMIEPDYMPLNAYPVAYTAGTEGKINAEAMVVDIQTKEDIELYRGKLKGKPSRTSKRYKALAAIDKIQRGEFYYNIDKTVGRFHSNLTNIKKELRQFVTYGNKKIVNMDIKNCQPLLSTLLLKSTFWKKSKTINIYQFSGIYKQYGNTSIKYNKNIQDILHYIMLVENSKSQASKGFQKYIKLVNSGDFYRGISKTIAPNTIYDKDKMKVMMFMVFFSSNRFIGQIKAIPKKLFKIKFPEVYKVFQLIKKNNHATLPIMLQIIESQIIVERATKRIGMERPNLPIFTIHDSIATIQGEEAYVESVLKETIFEYTGLSAKIGKEFW